MDKSIFRQLLNRPKDSHKYDFGHALVIGGSPGMVGAPFLVGKAALRTGAGLVTIASTKNVVNKLERRVEEIMTLALPDSLAETVAVVEKFIKERKVSVMVIGPGLKPEFQYVIRELIKNIELPIVIDGGGLGALQEHLDVLKLSPSKGLILTPHLGEFQRFFSDKLPHKREELKPIAQDFAKKHAISLVLKGQPTYVTHPNGEIYINDSGNAGLATAGTGDVLAGVIAGIVAQGIERGPAAEAGVYLHGLAGDIAAEKKTEPGMIASDVIEALPAALTQLNT